MIDLLIKDGKVIDGTSVDAKRLDVGIDGDRIVSVGFDSAAARQTLDARGSVIAPGFIDLHTHADFTLPSSPGCVTYLTQGVTTMVTGNCGFSPFPVHSATAGALRDHAAFFGAEIPFGEWRDLAGYRSFVNRIGPGCNLAPLVGHGSARVARWGFDDPQLTEGDLNDLRQSLRRELNAGAFGVSVGLIYAPSRYATANELQAVARDVASASGSFMASHIRGEGATVVEAVHEMLEIAVPAGAPLQLSHHKVMGSANWSSVSRTLAAVDRARASGADVTLDQYPYRSGNTTLAAILPDWVVSGGIQRVASVLNDSTHFDRARRQIAGQEGAESKIREFVPGRTTIMSSPIRSHIGRTVADIAKEERLDPVVVALKMLQRHADEIQIADEAVSEEVLRTVMRHPEVAIASDGWVLDLPEDDVVVHPRNLGTFPRILGRYARDLGVLTMEQAIRKMTLLPARRLGIRDRGIISPGAVADIVVFDPETVIDHATFKSSRLSEGIQHVLVGGRFALTNGEITGVRAGVVLSRLQLSDNRPKER